MTTNLNISVLGQKGGTSKITNDIGMVICYVDKEHETITIDAFEGSGENYKQREEVLINISDSKQETIWEGTFKELVAKLT